MSLPASLTPGDWTIVLNPASTAQLQIAAWATYTDWITVAQASLAAQGHPGVTLSNPRTVPAPGDATVGLAAIDVHVPQLASAGTVDVPGTANAQELLAGDLAVTLLLAAIRGAVAITVALVVVYVVKKGTATGGFLNPSTGAVASFLKGLAVLAIALLVFAVANFARDVRGAHAA